MVAADFAQKPFLASVGVAFEPINPFPTVRTAPSGFGSGDRLYEFRNCEWKGDGFPEINQIRDGSNGAEKTEKKEPGQVSSMNSAVHRQKQIGDENQPPHFSYFG